RKLTDELEKHLNVSYEDAEDYKVGGDGSVSSTSIFQEVQKISERISETLVTEIQKSVDFFAATTIDADVSRIYLSGGSSQLVSLIRSLEKRQRTPVELINPFRNVSVDSKRFDMDMLQRMAPMAAVSVGLGLRRAQSE
ncbi:MAG: pilus assembly protein PilM, partial [Myxococcota bacterium]|nr:pilus assembly protein PilM [Myxococcota bacterium]